MCGDKKCRGTAAEGRQAGCARQKGGPEPIEQAVSESEAKTPLRLRPNWSLYSSLSLSISLSLSLSSYLHPSAVIVIVLRSPSNPPDGMDGVLPLNRKRQFWNINSCLLKFCLSFGPMVLTLSAGLIVLAISKSPVGSWQVGIRVPSMGSVIQLDPNQLDPNQLDPNQLDL